MSFQQILSIWYGSSIQSLTIEKEDGLYLLSQNFPNQLKNTDKCKSCPAHIYRQDFPFWINSHKNKKLMVIAQDAGKGFEKWDINTVFSIHLAYQNLSEYFAASHRHIGYYQLFKDIIGTDDFLNQIYLTDIIKCAYSTNNKSLSLKDITCKSELFEEINEVNPSSILLMGKSAQNTFMELCVLSGITIKTILKINCRINKAGSISFTHFKSENNNIFLLPHVIGNLHISKEFKSEFENFKKESILYMNRILNT